MFKVVFCLVFWLLFLLYVFLKNLNQFGNI